jgi:hypothetical protein
MCVLPSRLILFDLAFSLVPGPLFLLASVALKVSALVSLRYILYFFYVTASSRKEGSSSLCKYSESLTII